MTTVDDGVDRSPATDPVDARASGAPPGDRRPWYAVEALRALELAGLAAFAFGRPILDSFGRSPETFVAREAGATTIVLFGVVVALVPPLAFALAGLASRPFGPATRRRVHLGLVAVAGGLAVWQLGQHVTGYPPESRKLIVAGVVAGLAVLALHRRWPSTRSFLRLVGAASVVFPVQFLLLSPTSGMVWGDGPRLDDDVTADVAAALGDDAPDVVVIVFDALPTMSLLDGEGRIDAALYPNFAAVAGDATWYRNHTTVSAFTIDAVPAVLSGRYPGGDRGEQDNLFTLLGGNYDAHVREQVTRECPSDVCPVDTSGGLGPLLGDAVDLWTRGVHVDEDATEFDLPGMDAGFRYDADERWIDDLVLDPGGRPDLVVHHMILPHEPWRVTDDGTTYDGGNPPTGYYINSWTRSGIEVGRQRHVLQLQAADRLLGRHLDKLREAGTYDDTLLVVTADHGASFLPSTPSRGLTHENYAEIMWSPLLIKAPGQTRPEVDDSDVRSVDVLPTIADLLGVEVPWRVDGRPAGADTGRSGRTKPFHDHRNNRWRAERDGEMFEVPVGDALERVLAADPVPWTGPDAVWKRTAHGDLFGRQVDELEVGRPADGAIAISGLDDLGDIAVDEPLPIEVVGTTTMDPGPVVAYALNGTIGAVGVIEEGRGPGFRLVHGIVPPSLFVDGENDLQAYLVEGEPGREVLRPLTLVPG